jgi:hypothetical protein
MVKKSKILKKNDEPSVPKKRGRKPKGGKIIENVVNEEPKLTENPNVILHLKVNSKDLIPDTNEPIIQPSNDPIFINFQEVNQNKKEVTLEKDQESSTQQTSINNKLKELQSNLHTNNISEYNSACFWCTFNFDTPPIYIPKYVLNKNYHVYGCFCSPECASAFLMNETIDSSSKFERYHLLNQIYAKIYNYNKNITPAPSPYYTLDKYYGNLTIQEYRSLLGNNNSFLIVDKPLTRIMPELHDYNDDYLLNSNKTIKQSFKIKNVQKSTKLEIVNSKFGSKICS